MQSSAKTVEEYLDSLPKDRQKAIKTVRQTILKSLPKGYEETMQYGMISYVVPISRYASGYLGDKKTALPYVCLASQKNHMAIYMMHVYGNKKLYEWFVSEYKKAEKKLDMGKSCLRFKKLDDLPLDLIGKVIEHESVGSYIQMYESSRKQNS